MLKILVVDDNFINRRLLVEVLRDRAVCDIAASGQEALEAYELSLNELRPYDAILLDVQMPEIDGLEVLRRVRDRERRDGVLLGQGVPVIMITAYKAPFLEAFNNGCDDYLLKPVTARTLLGKLEEKIRVS